MSVRPPEWGAKTGETMGVGPTLHEEEHSRDQGYLEGEHPPDGPLEAAQAQGSWRGKLKTLDADWTRPVFAKRPNGGGDRKTSTRQRVYLT